MTDELVAMAVWSASGGYALRALLQALSEKRPGQSAFMAAWCVLCFFVVTA